MPERLSDYTGQVSPEVVEINGVRLTLKEFDMRTRALWLDVANEFKLPELQQKLQLEVIPKISMIQNDIESDPRIKSLQSRMEKLSSRHDELIDVYATDDEPEDIDEQLASVVKRMETLQDEILEISKVVQDEVIDEAKNAEKMVTELMETQDKARVYFVWTLAKASSKTELDFDDFYTACDSDDYKAADRFLEEGNAPWASLYSSRMQERPKKKSKTIN